MGFQINPCKSVQKELENKKLDINTIKDICYGVCNAYDNPEGCAQQCKDLLSIKKREMGRDDSNYRLPQPPSWNQIPRNFPNLLLKTEDPEIAYKQCCIMAKQSKYPNSARDACKLDYNAVIQDKEYFTYDIIDGEDNHEYKRPYIENYGDGNTNESYGINIVYICSLLLFVAFIYYLYTKK